MLAAWMDCAAFCCGMRLACQWYNASSPVSRPVAGDNTSVTFAHYAGSMNVNRLRTRLILSYLAVVVITLVVMGLLLVLLLRGRPVASDPIYTRLISVSRLINERELATGAILSASRDTRIEQIVNGVASRTRSRVLLATVQDEVLYDSLALMEQGTFLELREMRRTPAEPELSQGNFRQGDEEWLFVMQEIPTRGGRVRLYFAALRPQSSWTEVLNLFGTSLLLPLLQAGLIGLVMAVVLAGVSSRGLVRVLGRLGAVAKGVAAGNYEERAPLEGPDEVRAVASAFNAMAEEVRASQIAQQDFLANVSHDLRTPLTSIQGFSQAIIDGTSQDSTYHAQIIYDEAGRLNRMVGELLDLARISSGRMSMKQSRVNVALVAVDQSAGEGCPADPGHC